VGASLLTIRVFFVFHRQQRQIVPGTPDGQPIDILIRWRGRAMRVPMLHHGLHAIGIQFLDGRPPRLKAIADGVHHGAIATHT